MTGATMMSATRSEGSVLVRASVDRLGRAIDEVAAVDGAGPEPDVSAAIDALLDLDDVVPGGLQNPDLKDLLCLTVDLRKAVHAGDQARAMELRAYCRLLLRRIFDHSLVATWDDPAAAFAQITGALSTASIKDLARLLGVSAKTISTWRAGGRIERGAPRVRAVAEIVQLLRSTFTASGSLQWFDTETEHLGGRTPAQALSAGPTGIADVTDFARRIHG